MQRLSCICFHKIVYRSYKSFLDTISNPVKVHYKQKIYFLKSYTYLISLLSWYILGSILIIPTKKPFTYFLFQFLVVSSNASVSRYIEAFGLGREGGKRENTSVGNWDWVLLVLQLRLSEAGRDCLPLRFHGKKSIKLIFYAGHFTPQNWGHRRFIAPRPKYYGGYAI